VEPHDLGRDDDPALACCRDFVSGGFGWSFEGGDASVVIGVSGSAAGVIEAIATAQSSARGTRAEVSCVGRATSISEAELVGSTTPIASGPIERGCARK